MKAKSNVKAKSSAKVGGSDEAALLLAIEALRGATEYQQAELMRRSLGAEQMARSKPDSKQYAGIRYLIGTWEGIAATVYAGAISKDRFFETQPVCHMWDALEDGIKISAAI